MVLKSDAPQHGGNLQQAVKHYGIPRADWLDLSTGIAPFSWPVPPVPAEVWQRLPEQDGALENAAQHYYGHTALPVPGSQWAIQQLPTLFAKSRVLVAAESYEEYRFCWQQQGHTVVSFNALPDASELHDHDIVIVINPNNPTAQFHSPQRLQQLAHDLRQKNGWLIVDEAFMDTTPEHSLLPTLQANQNVIVLRSLGKFFGLAGIRTGFVLGNADIQTTLQKNLGPWAISHPAQWIATQALLDTHWHAAQRERLLRGGRQLLTLLQRHFPAHAITATPLFVSITLQNETEARHWQDAIARHGIWIRHFPRWNRIRIGLADDAGLQRLAATLASL